MTNDIQEECKLNMEGSVEHMHHSFKSLRTGKVMVSILDGIKIDYYGTLTALDQVGSVIATDATTIVISPWEKPLVADIEAAISKANIGVNPNSDGEKIILNFPPMTVDQRKETVKKMKGLGEDAKIGAAGLIMAILGGSILPPLQASIINLDTLFGMPAVNVSFFVPLISFIIITIFGYRTERSM